MTFPVYKKDDQWYFSFKTVPEGKPDETVYIELSDSLNVDHPLNISKVEIKDALEHNNFYVGMYGLKEHVNYKKESDYITSLC